jgi:ASC-1-like (ASCH) protein
MSEFILKFREVNRDIFNMLVDGSKSIETRAATPKYRNLKDGDYIIAKCGDDTCKKRIKKATHFDSIDQMLEVYDLKHISPSVRSKEEAIKVWHSFPSYKEKLSRYGIMAFEL